MLRENFHNDEEVDLDVVQLLVEAAPEVLYAVDARGKLLLHHAREMGEVGLTRLLLQAAPATAMVPSSDGSLALHLAVTSQDISSAAIVPILLQLRPAAALHRDHRGCLPLHCAAGSSNSLSVNSPLIRATRRALLELDSYGHAPLHVCGAKSEEAYRLPLELDEYRERSDFFFCWCA